MKLNQRKTPLLDLNAVVRSSTEDTVHKCSLREPLWVWLHLMTFLALPSKQVRPAVATLLSLVPAAGHRGYNCSVRFGIVGRTKTTC